MYMKIVYLLPDRIREILECGGVQRTPQIHRYLNQRAEFKENYRRMVAVGTTDFGWGEDPEVKVAVCGRAEAKR
jgi:hypothetical protein